MRKLWQWIGIGVGGVLAVLVLVAAVLHFVGANRLNNAPDVAIAPIAVESDADSLARGMKLAQISTCTACHGADLSGEVFIDEAPIGYVTAPNLTAGAGGIGATYTVEDWDRALRHGIGADGRSLVIMPSYHYVHYGDDDLADLIAYLQSVPPVDQDLGNRRIGFPGTIIFGVLAFDDVTSATQIDHRAVGGDAPPLSASAEYGAYLTHVAMCGSCHGEDLAGASSPEGPQGPNITPAGLLQAYTLESFKTALRTGMTPSNRQLSTTMPWPSYSVLSDAELEALWAYLNGLPG